MSDDYSSDTGVFVEKKTKKRKISGRIRDVLKKLRFQSHEAGANCNCRSKCFEMISFNVRDAVLKNFNLLETTNEQNSYLCGLISIIPIQRRRPRLDPGNSKMKDVTCKYKIRSLVNKQVTEWPVCRKAFTAIHGITKKKVEYLINSLKMTGTSPKDMRGKHQNRNHTLSNDCLNLVKAHINSFNGRGAHYSLHDSSKKYLPEDLNINKMYKMFKETNTDINISYESYRNIFNKDFNISFGFPRTDTCSFCDENNVKLQSLKFELNQSVPENKKEIETKIRQLEMELKLHLKKDENFYDIKRKARLNAKKVDSYEAVCMDFGRNLCVPNVTTNDAYYKRQLSIYCFNIHMLGNNKSVKRQLSNYCFNIHMLGNNKSVFYMYPESEGKKGSSDVCDMVYHFMNNHLPDSVENLHIFADSCGGQNKNITIFRFLHYLVHVKKRFKSIQLTYPIRGHSYMECDRNMGLIKSNFNADLPSDWSVHFSEVRQKSSPFIVEEIDHTFWHKWPEFLNLTYTKKLPVLIRPMKELQISYSAERLMYFRENYSGHWESVILTLPVRKRFVVDPSELPGSSYEGTLAISEEKFKDILDLSRFCKKVEAKFYYMRLNHSDKAKKKKTLKTLKKKALKQ